MNAMVPLINTYAYNSNVATYAYNDDDLLDIRFMVLMIMNNNNIYIYIT